MILSFLLADDSPPYRRILRTVLSANAEWEVIAEASGGEETLRLADRFKPGVILMDIDMPDRNGIDVTQLLRASHPDVRILLFTGHGVPRLRRAGLEAGADAVIGKEQISASLLDDCIDRWFNRSEQNE